MRSLTLLLMLTLGLIACRRQASQEQPGRPDHARQLGHYLFFDQRLSFNGTKSCSSCHDPRFAFTDGYKRSITATGEHAKRNAPTLINVVHNRYFNWADTATTLMQQHRGPLLGTEPVEMGAAGHESDILQALLGDTLYQRLFPRAFPGTINWNMDHVLSALAAYVASLQSFNAPYDCFMAGDSAALSPAAQRGLALFGSERLQCATCHVPPTFGADPSLAVDRQFYNICMHNPADRGLFEVTGDSSDLGKFRVPTLRNLQYTAPYFHDGSAETLDDALAIFLCTSCATDALPGIHRQVRPIRLSTGEYNELVAFLLHLNDPTLADNPNFSDPFATKDPQLP